jgi:rod shape-determining protein MreB
MFIKDISSGSQYSDTTDISIKKENDTLSILNIGSKAKLDVALKGVTLKNGFNHPRIIIGDFSLAEKTLIYFLKKILHNKIIRPSPVMVIHIKDKLEGGLSGIEERALMELGTGAGAREVHIWQGKDLTDEDIAKNIYKRVA